MAAAYSDAAAFSSGSAIRLAVFYVGCTGTGIKLYGLRGKGSEACASNSASRFPTSNRQPAFSRETARGTGSFKHPRRARIVRIQPDCADHPKQVQHGFSL